jgi:hypothetical protein
MELIGKHSQFFEALPFYQKSKAKLDEGYT